MGLVAVEWLEPKNYTLQSASAATENGTPADLQGRYGVLLVQVVGSTWTGTIDFKVTQNGTDYVAVEGVNINSGAKVTSTTGDGIFQFTVAGAKKFMADHTRTAGSVTVTATAQAIPVGASADVQLGASSVVIGKVGIDQTTPGTTNLVQVGGTLPAFASTPAVTVSGRTVTDVTLQSAAVATGNGTAFTATNSSTLYFEVTGTSTSRTVVFEMAGPGGTHVSATAFKVTDPSVSATQTTTAADATPESWQADVPAGWSFRARISAVAGGNVSVTGKAVVA